MAVLIERAYGEVERQLLLYRGGVVSYLSLLSLPLLSSLARAAIAHSLNDIAT